MSDSDSDFGALGDVHVPRPKSLVHVKKRLKISGKASSRSKLEHSYVCSKAREALAKKRCAVKEKEILEVCSKIVVSTKKAKQISKKKLKNEKFEILLCLTKK